MQHHQHEGPEVQYTESVLKATPSREAQAPPKPPPQKTQETYPEKRTTMQQEKQPEKPSSKNKKKQKTTTEKGAPPEKKKRKESWTQSAEPPPKKNIKWLWDYKICKDGCPCQNRALIWYYVGVCIAILILILYSFLVVYTAPW